MVSEGVVMNPVDHPHGGGEGRTKGGRTMDHGLNGQCLTGFSH